MSGTADLHTVFLRDADGIAARHGALLQPDWGRRLPMLLGIGGALAVLIYGMVALGFSPSLFIDGMGNLGFIIGLISSWYGFTATDGSEGVGRAATQSVVASSLAIILADVILVKAIFFLFPGGAI